MDSHDSLPPLDVLQAALSKTTEALVRELADPTMETPYWSDFEWRIAEAAVVIQGISALLANGLRWRGPERWETFLAEQKRHTLLRRQRIAELLDGIDIAARQAGIAAVALKGSALYGIGAYPRGDRPMSDVDLLVKDADVEAAADMLTALGYKPGFDTERHRTFERTEASRPAAFGEHVDNPIAIDLHCRISEHLPVLETDITALEFPPHAHPGLNPYPSVAALMRHLLLHTAGSLRARALRFIQLHDIAVLATRMRGEDWNEFLRENAGERGTWWAFAPLTLTDRYFPQAIPRMVLAAAAAGCPWMLRRIARRHTLMDVSWAKLRIQAFPGIEWCGSVPEALEFMISRLLPDRARLRRLQTVTAKRPYGASVPWYGLSHGKRIFRWLFSSPPRVQAIYPIRVVLGIQPP